MHFSTQLASTSALDRASTRMSEPRNPARVCLWGEGLEPQSEGRASGWARGRSIGLHSGSVLASSRDRWMEDLDVESARRNGPAGGRVRAHGREGPSEGCYAPAGRLSTCAAAQHSTEEHRREATLAKLRIRNSHQSRRTMEAVPLVHLRLLEDLGKAELDGCECSRGSDSAPVDAEDAERTRGYHTEAVFRTCACGCST